MFLFLDMSPEEAVQDAIETCLVQGGDLYFVIKKNVENDGRHLIINLVDNLVNAPSDINLEKFSEECKIFECRHFAATNYHAHQKFAKNIEKKLENGKIEELIIFIKSLSELLKGQPDWIDNFIILVIRNLTEKWKKISENNDIKDIEWEYVAAVAQLVEISSKNHEGIFFEIFSF